MLAVDPERVASTAIDWAAAEGWNPGVDDAERFHAADPDAFIGVEIDGELAGAVSCALYGERYAFIGFYIVRWDLRGRGIGTGLFDRALSRAGDRVVGLDGVLAQQPVYASLGFELAHRNERWHATGGGTRPQALVDVAGLPFDDLVDYDASIFGAARRGFLRSWIDREPGHALARLEDGRITGYAVLRRCREGAKVGPLFADDAETA
jgi:GNAT superfamily N-acetyltransferase